MIIITEQTEMRIIMEKAWTRRELKEKSKTILGMQYWRMVLVAFIVSVLCSGSFVTDSVPSMLSDQSTELIQTHVMQQDSASQKTEVVKKGKQKLKNFKNSKEFQKTFPAIVISFIAVIVMGMIVVGFTILIIVFVCNPFSVGAARFMSMGFEKKPKFKELFFALEHEYRNVVDTMFLRSLYTFLWSLLFIIPGIVKKYEYRMVPYILAQTPDMNKKQALALSSQMMHGQKWNAFVLDLSFLGWRILSGITLGLVGTFYASPYIHLTNASLYRTLQGLDEQYGNIYIG